MLNKTMLDKKRIALWLGTGVAALTLGALAMTHPAKAQSPMPGPGSVSGGSYPGSGTNPGAYPGPGRFPSPSASSFHHAIHDLDKIAAHLRSVPGDYGGHRDRALALIAQAQRELRKAAYSGGNGYPRPGGSFPGSGSQPGAQPYPGH